ncbi:MAG: metallophosphoesterase [Clostridiales bacterium]|nr:metallophosphoesterase [Candidatus Apopatousia equi]
MKIFAISDLHLSINTNKPMNIFGPVWQDHFETISSDWKEKVGEDDIVLISGDISWGMKLDEAIEDIKEIAKLPGKKIITRGNHDYWWKSISLIRNSLPENMFALQNDAIKFGDYIICGTRGWTVPETNEQSADDKKIFDRELIRLELSLKSAKDLQQNDEKIVCMIHYPPFNSRIEESGFTNLMEKYGVCKVVYGHLHGKGGRTIIKLNKNGIDYYLTSCDKLGNRLIDIFEEE